MDPSQLQSDTDNDVHSLEGTSTIVESNGQATATGNETSSTPASSRKSHNSNGTEKTPLWKRLWQKLNIYILLFMLLVLIAGAVVVVLFVKSRNAADKQQGTVGSQNLSPNELKQLSNSGVTIGNPKQVLNVASNAIFSGSLLVRNNLEVAGSLKIGGQLNLPGITVSGVSKFDQIQAASLTVTGATNVLGQLTARHGLTVTGEGTFTGAVTASQISAGSLNLNGDLNLTHHITAGGPIPALSGGNALGAGGTASISGSDTAGSVTINTGSGAAAGCFATVRFTKAFANTPHVLVTPVGSGAATLNYYISRTTSDLSICTVSPPPSGQTFGFDYVVLS
jgi:hypothetical protein